MPLPTPPLQAYNNQFEIPQTHNITGQIDQSLGGGTAVFQFPSDRPKYYTILKLATRGTVGYAAVDIGTIVLPLPMNLIDVHKVKYDEKPIVPWASILTGVLPAATYGLTGSLIASAGAGVVTNFLANQGSGLFGLAPNEFPTMLFDRPEFKRHELSFKLSPRNHAESEQIRNILVVLNNAMSPGTTAGGFLFTFPNIVQTVFKPNDGWLYKFKPAVIESLAVNYAGGDGKKAFYHDPMNSAAAGDNPPESVELTLHLIEIEYWLHGHFGINNTQGTGSMTGTTPGLPSTTSISSAIETVSNTVKKITSGGGR